MSYKKQEKNVRTGKRPPPAAMADMFDEVDEVPAAPGEAPGEAPTAPDSAGPSPAAPAGVLTRRELERCKVVVGEIACREVRSFAAALFPELGPTTLRLAFGIPYDRSALFVVTSSRDAYTRAREDGVPVFVMRELVALAHAAQNDRMPPPTFARMLERKCDSPGWVLSPEDAFGGMPLANAEPLSCTLGDAFDKMGVRLLSVEVHGT